MSDAVEYLLSTDPRDPDTDKDGISEGMEIAIFGSNPRSPDLYGYPLPLDSDKDRLSDFVESHLRPPLSSTNPDTDGDGKSDW